MNTMNLGPKEERLLAVLAEGGSSRDLARKLRYSEGTVRVYLHRLYKALGVRNRTEAVVWHLNRSRAASPPAQERPPILGDETFADAALREGLLGALGIMESFLGPYGRIWQAGIRLKGGAVDARTLARRERTRRLWRALLDGDFGLGKRLHEEGGGELHPDAPAGEGLLWALLLHLGGYSRAADQVTARLGARKPPQGLATREVQLLRVVRDAMHDKSGDPIASLLRLASQGQGNAPFRQMALAAVFHLGRMRKDAGRAASAADALWAEAESARSQLEAMGIRPLGRAATLPRARLAGRPAAVSSSSATETAR